MKQNKKWVLGALSLLMVCSISVGTAYTASNYATAEDGAVASSVGLQKENLASLFEQTTGSDWGNNFVSMGYAELPATTWDYDYDTNLTKEVNTTWAGKGGLNVVIGNEGETSQINYSENPSTQTIHRAGITFKKTLDLSDNTTWTGTGFSGNNASEIDYTPLITLAFPGTGDEITGYADASSGARAQQFNDFVIRLSDKKGSVIDISIGADKWARLLIGTAVEENRYGWGRDYGHFALTDNGQLSSGRWIDERSISLSGSLTSLSNEVEIVYVRDKGIYAVCGNAWRMIRDFSMGADSATGFRPFYGFGDGADDPNVDKAVTLSVFAARANTTLKHNAAYTIMNIDGIDLTANANGIIDGGEKTVSAQTDKTSVLKGESVAITSVTVSDFLSTTTVEPADYTVSYGGNSIPVTDGAFVPTESGTYTIGYVGGAAAATVEIEVVNIDNSTMTITDSGFKPDGSVGMTVEVKIPESAITEFETRYGTSTVKVVFTLNSIYDTLENVVDAYDLSKRNSADTKVKVETLTTYTEVEGYRVYKVLLTNVQGVQFADGFTFGAYLANMDETKVVSFGEIVSTQTVYAAAIGFMNSHLTEEITDNASYTVAGKTYYSNGATYVGNKVVDGEAVIENGVVQTEEKVVSQRIIFNALYYYYNCLRYKYISDVEVAGWTIVEVEGTTYYYDATALSGVGCDVAHVLEALDALEAERNA